MVVDFLVKCSYLPVKRRREESRARAHMLTVVQLRLLCLKGKQLPPFIYHCSRHVDDLNLGKNCCIFFYVFSLGFPGEKSIACDIASSTV